jgi:hypothetical protein
MIKRRAERDFVDFKQSSKHKWTIVTLEERISFNRLFGLKAALIPNSIGDL